MNTARQLFLIIVITAVAALVTWRIHGPPQRIPFCDPASLKPDEICLADVPANVLWVDARSRADWMRNGVAGSILWNLDPAEDAQQMEAEAVARIIQHTDVVVYCGDESCGISRQIADRIRALGMGVHVRVLFGGWQALGRK
jgi:hypothetical protein